MDIVDIDVFLNDNIFGYILRIPIVHSVVYNLYNLIPFPTKVRNSENTFVFISSEEDYLLMDTLNKCMLNLVTYKWARSRIFRQGCVCVNRYFP
jgi:hypothetical protein